MRKSVGMGGKKFFKSGGLESIFELVLDLRSHRPSTGRDGICGLTAPCHPPLAPPWPRQAPAGEAPLPPWAARTANMLAQAKAGSGRRTAGPPGSGHQEATCSASFWNFSRHSREQKCSVSCTPPQLLGEFRGNKHAAHGIASHFSTMRCAEGRRALPRPRS